VDYRAILSALADGGVRFIVVGGVAAVLQGVSVHTYDVDVVHARDAQNRRRLIEVLRRLEAHYRQHRTKRLEPKEEDLALGGHHLLMTRFGPLDLLGSVMDTRTYEDLIERSPITDLGHGLRVNVLDLAVIIAIKAALGREKDRAQLPEYRRTLEERGKLGGGARGQPGEQA
jgi:predicted nucleotidyltransferase